MKTIGLNRKKYIFALFLLAITFVLYATYNSGHNIYRQLENNYTFMLIYGILSGIIAVSRLIYIRYSIPVLIILSCLSFTPVLSLPIFLFLIFPNQRNTIPDYYSYLGLKKEDAERQQARQELLDLKELENKGIITADEFNEKRQKFIDKV